MPNKPGVSEQNAPNANLVMEGGSFYNRCPKPMDVALKLLINGVALLYVVVLISALDYILVDGLGYAS